jgi:hypothetical protein
MSLRRFRRVVAGAAAVSLGLGCDHPTAPLIRPPAPTVQPDLSGAGLRTELGSSITQAIFSARFPTGLLTVDHDGYRGRYVAVVMERVYLPPPASGAAPWVRHMLMAWDPESRREFAFESDDSSASIAPLPFRRTFSEGNYWNSLGFATQLEEHSADTWLGVSGIIEITADTRTGDCSHAGLGETVAFLFVEPTVRDTCQEMSYNVAISATLEHRNADGRRDLLDRLIGRDIAIRIDPQRVPGVRVVTQCIDDQSMKAAWIVGCMHRENFWRSPSQFSAKLGLDLGRLTTVGYSFHMQHVVEGSGPALNCCRQYTGHVRYTVFTPGGGVLRHVDDVEAARDTVLRELWLDGALREGSRTLMLIPGRAFDRTGSDFAMHVLDLTVLPCPAGVRRDGTSFPGNAYPDGGCYPPSHFPKGK